MLETRLEFFLIIIFFLNKGEVKKSDTDHLIQKDRDCGCTKIVIIATTKFVILNTYWITLLKQVIENKFNYLKSLKLLISIIG